MSNLRLLPQSNPRGYGTARVWPEKSDHPRYRGEPVADYWQALHALLAEFEKTGEYYEAGPLPFAADLVGRIFWVHPEVLRRDLIKLRKAQVL